MVVYKDDTKIIHFIYIATLMKSLISEYSISENIPENINRMVGLQEFR